MILVSISRKYNLISMKRHLSLVDDASAIEWAAVLEAFEWAVDVLGILPDERALLVRPRGDPTSHGVAKATEAKIRHIVAIADDVQALIGDEDEIREWLRSPNPGLWTDGPVRVSMTPLHVMLDHADGVRGHTYAAASGARSLLVTIRPS